MSIHVKNQHLTFQRLKLLHANIFTFLPKYKQLFADLLHCTNEPNVSIPTLANLLIERRENPESQLGGRLQGPHHHPPPHVLWQWGSNISVQDLQCYLLSFFAEVRPVCRLKQQQLSAQWLPGQDRSSGWVNDDLKKKLGCAFNQGCLRSICYIFGFVFFASW